MLVCRCACLLCYLGIGSNGAGSNNYAATASELSVPVGLAMDTTGNLYIAGCCTTKSILLHAIIAPQIHDFS